MLAASLSQIDPELTSYERSFDHLDGAAAAAVCTS